MPVQVSQVTHNNNAHFYRIAIDIAKEGTEVWDLTPYFKGRVGDDNFGLQIVWYYQGRLLDVTNKTPYIKGNVGHYSFDDKKNLQMAADADVVTSHGNPNDCQANGQVTYYFPQQMFPTDGVFKGFIGLEDENQNLTGVDIWFRVLPGVAQMGRACDFYVDILDKTIANFKEKIRQQSIDFDSALQQELQKEKDLIQQKLDAASGAIDEDTATLKKLAASVGAIQAQIDAGDVVTRADFTNQINATKASINKVSGEISAKLSQMKTQPTAYASLDIIKQKYPQGDTAIYVAADTNHWYYWNGSDWIDGGIYNSQAVDQAYLDKTNEAESYANGTNLISNGNFTTGNISPAVAMTDDTVLDVTDYIGQKWLRIKSNGSKRYRGVQWTLANTNREIITNPLRIAFTIQSSISQTLTLNLVVTSSDGTTLTKTLNTIYFESAWKFIRYNNSVTLANFYDDISKLADVTSVKLQLFKDDGEDLGTILLNNVYAGLDYTAIKDLAGSLIWTSDGTEVFPVYPYSSGTKINTVNYLNQKWLKVSSTSPGQYQGIRWSQVGPLDSAVFNVVYKFVANIQSYTNQSLDLAVIGYDAKGNRLLTNVIRSFKLKAYDYTHISENITIPSNFGTDITNVTRLRFALYSSDAKGTGTFLINNVSIRQTFNNLGHIDKRDQSSLVKSGNDYLLGINNSDYYPTTTESVLNVADYGGRKWLQITASNTTQTVHGGAIKLREDAVTTAFAMPTKVKALMQSSLQQTLTLGVSFFDANHSYLGGQNLATLNFNAWEYKQIDTEYQLIVPDGVDQSKIATIDLILQRNQPGDIGKVMMTDISVKPYFDFDETSMDPEDKGNYVKSGNNYKLGLSDNSYYPTTSETVLKVGDWAGQKWLQIETNGTTQVSHGVAFKLKESLNEVAFNVPLKLEILIQSSIKQTLSLDASYFDSKHTWIGGQNLDKLDFNDWQYRQINKEYKLRVPKDIDQSNIASIEIILQRGEAGDLGKIMLNGISVKPAFDPSSYDPSTIISNKVTTVTTQIPVVSLNGDVSGVSKDDSKLLSMTYTNGEYTLKGYADTHWQGDSSLAWDKKAYRIKTFKDADKTSKLKFKPCEEWSADNKFNLKAYYTDPLLARDPVNAKIGGDIWATQKNLPEGMITADNFGFIDGFPIKLFINGRFEGIYSFNLAKGDYGDAQAAISGEKYNDITQFNTIPEDGVKLDGTDFSMITPDDATPEIKQSATNLARFIATADQATFTSQLSNYLDVDSVIDYLIFNNIVANGDAWGKNETFVTYDGTKWYLHPYDLDVSYGTNYDGSMTDDNSTGVYGIENNLFNKLNQYMPDKIKARYTELRSWLTPAYVIRRYRDWVEAVGLGNYKLEHDKWNNPNWQDNDFNRLKRHIYRRFKYLDQHWLKS
ncbi:CotH kinase family protein [Limosilactobacillus reuteri]|uniref:CotH kinase family protein n=1 Tax=Limosilactobacillus reuteri TaxID=1598 RepID=UPI001E2EAE88|nr:CotH kinase family protein [Limosilactobacillus reuteri]MCC4346108.1 CotH kinase family protein [Limosilactobacillus reuteri]